MNKARTRDPSWPRRRRLPPSLAATLGSAVAVAFVCALFACDPPTPTASRPDVLMLVVDTLRADHVGSYDSPWDLTPNVDRLATESVTFRDTVAQGSNTINSSPSLLASVYPSEHGYTSYRVAVSPEHVTLAEILADAGYETFAVSTNPHVSARNGMAQGFETFVEHTAWTEASAEAVNSIFLDWLAQREDPRPYFALLWYIDPHVPYLPPEDLIRKHVVEANRRLVGKRTSEPGSVTPTLEEREVAKALYRGEVEYWDRSFGVLRNELERRGEFDDSLVVFTSDHGESFWEHRDPDGRPIYGHGASLYRHETSVPLIVRFPGSLRTGVVEQRVDLIDVAPTVTDFLRVEPGGRRPPFRGDTLLPLLNGELGHGFGSTVSELISDVRRRDSVWMTSVETDVDKLIVTRIHRGRRLDPPLVQLVDPRAGERPVPTPPGSAAADLRRQLLARLRAWRAGLRPIEAVAAYDDVHDAELVERLKALGYLN